MHYVLMMSSQRKRDDFLEIFNNNPVKIRCVGGWTSGTSILDMCSKKKKGSFGRVGVDEGSPLEKVTVGSLMKRNRLGFLPHELMFQQPMKVPDKAINGYGEIYE